MKTFQQMVEDQIAEVRADATGPIDSSSHVTFLLDTNTKIFQTQSKRALNPAHNARRLYTLVLIAAIAQRAAEDLKLTEEKE